MSGWVWLAAGLLLGADWLRRSVAATLGMSKIADVSRPEWDRLPRLTGQQPSIRVVVPARNEEQMIEQCLRSLLTEDYPELEICAVDDRSTDSTGTIMERLQAESGGKLKVIHISDLPEGWLGKTHAMWQGAHESRSDWILFTDGDIVFRPDALRRTIAYAELTECDHLVVFPTLIMKGFGERMMLGYFGFSSTLLLRPWKVRDPKARDHIGAGAFNLIRREAYEAVGSYEALRMEIIDDLKLGDEVKKHGLRQDCVRGPGLVSLRWAEGAMGVVNNLRKNMFSLLRFSWALASLAAIATLIYQLGPWLGVALAPGLAKVGFAIALFSIALLYVQMSLLFGLSPWYLFTHPIATLMFVYALLLSAASSVIHRGVLWRGTTYSVEQIQSANKQSRRERQERRRMQGIEER